MPILFAVLALGLAGLAAAAAIGSAYVVAVGAGALACWMGSLAVAAFRRRA